MTSLRTTEGLDLQHVTEHFGKQKGRPAGKQCFSIYHSNQMEKKQEKLVLTREGKLFADGIARHFF
jgi:oxygen-independent coproporphyrinogen-3 oxidase